MSGMGELDPVPDMVVEAARGAFVSECVVEGHRVRYVPDPDIPGLLTAVCSCSWRTSAAGRRRVVALWVLKHVGVVP